MKQNQERNTNERNPERLQDTVGTGRNDEGVSNDRGGTADLDGIVRRSHSTGTGSGMASKQGVTGSDLDGQVADQ